MNVFRRAFHFSKPTNKPSEHFEPPEHAKPSIAFTGLRYLLLVLLRSFAFRWFAFNKPSLLLASGFNGLINIIGRLLSFRLSSFPMATSLPERRALSYQGVVTNKEAVVRFLAYVHPKQSSPHQSTRPNLIICPGGVFCYGPYTHNGFARQFYRAGYNVWVLDYTKLNAKNFRDETIMLQMFEEVVALYQHVVAGNDTAMAESDAPPYLLSDSAGAVLMGQLLLWLQHQKTPFTGTAHFISPLYIDGLDSLDIERSNDPVLPAQGVEVLRQALTPSWRVLQSAVGADIAPSTAVKTETAEQNAAMKILISCGDRELLKNSAERFKVFLEQALKCSVVFKQYPHALYFHGVYVATALKEGREVFKSVIKDMNETD